MSTSSAPSSEAIRSAILQFVGRCQPVSSDEICGALCGTGLSQSYDRLRTDPLWGIFKSGATREEIRREVHPLASEGSLQLSNQKYSVPSGQSDANSGGGSGSSYASRMAAYTAATKSSSAPIYADSSSSSSSVSSASAPQRPSFSSGFRPTSVAIPVPASSMRSGNGNGAGAGGSAALDSSSSSSTAAEAVDDAPLSSEQQAVYDLAMSGVSLFFTGSAGTGKSFLLKKLIRGLRDKHGDGAVFVTAPTGIAACNIGGTTIHSFAGIGRGEGGQQQLAMQVNRKVTAVQRWKAAKVLILDEISMLDGELFDTLEYIARYVRSSPSVFGGVQLICAGDFHQLPPVGLGDDSSSSSGGGGGGRGGRGGWRGGGHGGYNNSSGGGYYSGDRSNSNTPSAPRTVKFCFDADCWSRAIYASVGLTQVFRQKDPRFVNLLNELRMGKVTPQAASIIAAAGSAIPGKEAMGIKPTRIYALNRDVDAVNAAELARCNGQAMTFNCRDVGEEPFLSQLQKNSAAPEALTLKVGVQVMLLKNVEPALGLVNGARGVVTGFVTVQDEDGSRTVPEVAFTTTMSDSLVLHKVLESEWSVELGGTTMATRTQIPLKLAYALSSE